MPSIPPIPADVLLTHASFLRGLAKGLLGDDHAAEDVLQETWVMALERPPANRAKLAGWLSHVTRGLALKRRRGEGRRQRREQEAARGEALDSVDEVVQQQEILRRVVDAVLGLGEPYRRVVLMRYYQDLSPREIAARLGVPAATVDSRLHRARAKLRDRLDRSDGVGPTWAQALVVLTGWKAPATAAGAGAAVATGGFAMAMKSGWALASVGATAGLVSVAAVLGPRWWSPGAARPNPEVVGAGGELRLPADVQELVQPPRTEDEPVAQRVTVDAEEAGGWIEVATPGRFEYVFEGTVVDAWDRPVAGVRVFAAPARQPLNDCGVAGDDGRFRIAWVADEPALELVVHLRKNGWTGFGLQRFDLRPGQGAPNRLQLLKNDEANQLAMQIDRLRAVERLARTDDGPRRLARAEQDLHRVQVRWAEEERRARFAPPSVPAIVERSGRTRFQWPSTGQIEALDEQRGEQQLERQLVERALEQELAERDRQAALDLQRLRSLQQVAARLGERADAGPVTAEVRGWVFSADGEPAVCATVYAYDGHRAMRAETRLGGAFELEVTTGRTLELFAGGGDRGVAETTLDLSEVAAGEQLQWTARLDRGNEIAGRLVDEQGEPLHALFVEARVHAGRRAWSDSTRSLPTGEFSIPNVPAGGGTLHVRKRPYPPFGGKVLASVGSGADLGDVVVTSEELASGNVQVELVDALGERVERAEARLWQESTGRGAWMTDCEAGYCMAEIPPGAYQLTVGSYERGFLDLGRVWVGPGGTTDLGQVVLPEPARVQWKLPPEREGARQRGLLEWNLVRTDSPVRVQVARGSLGRLDSDVMPAGSYELRLSGPDFSAPPLSWTLREAQHLQLGVPLDRYREVRFELPGPGRAGAQVPLEITGPGGERFGVTWRAGASERLLLPVGAYRVRTAGGDPPAASLDFLVEATAPEPHLLRLELP